MKDEQEEKSGGAAQVRPLKGLYEDWFLDYASYVILERAVPAIEDGLKPVQRRILHAMKEMDDGRFNKVANVIGQTMQYHPHGDAAIGDAMVNLGQKDLLIETQGNWGDIRTGDSSAAPRYIEARLSKFALEVSFNKQTTEWQASYDGRKNEPIHLPVKFPLVLAQGVEGIAVGLSTKILPHNFCELIQASINALRKKKVQLFPDFPTGGAMDVSDYNEGRRGGRIKLRAKIEEHDRKTLIIREIPYVTTTSSLIESIVKANDQGKIKIKRITDNTAEDVEIQIDLPSGTSTDLTISALYAFTDCEVSVSPNACVIIDNKPHFMSVNELLKISTIHTMDLLKWELEIRKVELEDKWHNSSLEKIFIENRIYRDIEECETWEAVLEAIDLGLEPFKKSLKREVGEEDLIRLTEIKIKRISKFDSFKADELIRGIEEQMEENAHNLANLTAYGIDYFKGLLKKYGEGRERRTEIREFDQIERSNVIISNQKLYIDRKEGFVGTGLKKAEFLEECSALDDVIVFRKDGNMLVTKVDDKKYVGKNILYSSVWKKGDDRKTYHMIYQDLGAGKAYVKRFNVKSITRDKEYNLCGGAKSKVLYLSAHNNSERETVEVLLSPQSKARKKLFEFDFGELAIKGRGAKGNTLSKYAVKKVNQKEIGASTIGGIKVWYDENQGRLNTEERGRFLGEFDSGAQLLSIYKDGSYKLQDFDVANRYEVEDILLLSKYEENLVVSAIHYVSGQQITYLKRFQIETNTLDKKFHFISEKRGSKLLFASFHPEPEIKLTTGSPRKKKESVVQLSDQIDIKGWKAIGNKLSDEKVLKIEALNDLYSVVDMRIATNERSSSKNGSPDSSKELFD